MEDSGTNVPSGPIDVYDVIALMIDQMSSIAWQKLGLQHDWGTQKIERDLTQAKVAIDCTTQLSAFVELRLDDDDRKRIQTLIRDLRLNFVQQSQVHEG